MSDLDYYGALNGPTDADIEDAAEREQDALAEAEAVLARDTAFCAWLREERKWHGWGSLIADVGAAQCVGRPRAYMKPCVDLARAESWPYVLRLIADVMEREPFNEVK